MKKIATSIIILLLFSHGYSQKDSTEVLFAYRITDYKVPLNDSVTVVQINIPDALPLSIGDKQIGILKHRYANGSLDTNLIGWGRCHLIKNNYYYFAIHKYNEEEPQQGDLLYVRTNLPAYYKSPLVDIIRHAVDLTAVDESRFYYISELFQLDQQKETKILDSMIADIRYTAREMKKQMPAQNKLVEGGMFDGRQLFDAMETATRQQLIEFLKYMAARPANYAGNTWKLSEIFATWMMSRSPQVISN